MLEVINFNLVYQPQGDETYTANTSGTLVLNNILGKHPHQSRDRHEYLQGTWETSYPETSRLVLHGTLKGKAFRVTSKDIIKLI